MSLPQPLESQPPQTYLRTARRRQRRPPSSFRAVAAEISIKLLLNSLLAAAAIAAITKLLPYHTKQQAELKEVRIEVARAQKRVDRLRDSFGRNFDPQQARSAMKEYSPWVEPNRHRVFWLEPKTTN